MARDPMIWLAAIVRILLKRVQELELKHERISMLDTKGYIENEAWDKGEDDMGSMDLDNVGNKDMGNMSKMGLYTVGMGMEMDTKRKVGNMDKHLDTVGKDTMSDMDFDSMGKQDNMGTGQDIMGMGMEMDAKTKVDNMDRHLDIVGKGTMSNMVFNTMGKQDSTGKGLDMMGVGMDLDAETKVDNMDKHLDIVGKDTMSNTDLNSMGKQDSVGKGLDIMDKQDNRGMDLDAKEQLHDESDEWLEGDSNVEKDYGCESGGNHGHDSEENFRDIDDCGYRQLIPRSDREIPHTMVGIGEVSLTKMHHHVAMESLKGLRCMGHRLSDGEAATAAILAIYQTWPYLAEFSTHGEGRAFILEGNEEADCEIALRGKI